MEKRTYVDRHGVERDVMPIHFGHGIDDRVNSSRRWWLYLRRMKPEDQPRYIKEWFRAGLIDDAQLWDVLGSFGSPVSAWFAVAIYEDLGFEPLAGYPLTPK